MNPAQVRALIPEPETYEEWMGGNLNDSLLYRGLILGFNACDTYGPLPQSEFTDIVLNRREDVVIWGKNILAWTKDDLANYLAQNGIYHDRWKFADIRVPSLSLWLSFDNEGILERVEMWRAGDRAEQIVGPERSQVALPSRDSDDVPG